MNISLNTIVFIVSMLIVAGITVYTLGESMKKLRLRVMSLQLEIEKARKAFEWQERHKRKQYYQQREAYLRLPIAQTSREQERV